MLSALTTLQMGQNLLSKTIPEQMMRMTQLQTLDLSTNVLTGTLPASLGTLTMLRVFKVDNNGIKGAVPNSYCNLVSSGGSLETFDITGDGAITCFPKCLAPNSATSTAVLLHDSTVGVCGSGTNRNPGTVTVSNGSDPNTVIIAGGIAGGIVFLVCVVGCVFLAMRSRYSKGNDNNTKVVVVQQQNNPTGKARRPTQATPPRDEEVGNPLNGRRASTRPQSLKPLPLSSGPSKAPLKPFTPQMQQPSHNRGGRDGHEGEEEDEEEEEDEHGDHFSPDAPRGGGGGGGGGWRGRGGGDDDDVSVGSEVSASGGPAKRFTFNTMGALTKPSEGPPRNQGQGQGQGQGSDGEGSEGERSGSEYGSDGSEGENKLERPGGPGQEQRFMLGINPMAGRGPPPRLQPHPHSDSSHHQQQWQQQGQQQGGGLGGLPTVARPVAPNPPRPRVPGDPAPPRGVGGAPSHMSIRPEMQQAALGKNVGAALLSGGGMPRPPPPPRPPGQW